MQRIVHSARADARRYESGWAHPQLCPRHARRPPPAPRNASPCHAGDSRSSPAASIQADASLAPAVTLYGSRTSLGRRLLQVLLAAPDLAQREGGTPQPPPSTDSPAPPQSALNPALDEVAALVLQVAGLMASHSDAAGLQQAFERAAAQVAAARRAGGVGSSSSSSSGPPPSMFGSSSGAAAAFGAGRFGGSGSGSGSGGGIGGGWGSARSGAGGGGGGGGGGIGDGWGAGRSSAATGSGGIGGGWGSGAGRSGSTAGGKLGNSSGSSSSSSSSSTATPASGSASPSASGPAGPASPAAAAAAAGPATSAASETAPGSWSGVRRVVVLGLGSLGAYQAALRSGRQTERESTRAAARLYQLALSLLLASPRLLPGLRRSGDQAAESADGQGQGQGQPQGGSAARVAGSTASPATAAAVAAPAAPVAVTDVLSYFDPEYLQWDLDLVRHLWEPRSSSSDTTSSSSSSSRGGTDGSPSFQVTPLTPPTAAVVAAAAAAPAAALVAHVPTLYYAPCCPREVYDAIVRQNLEAGTLRHVALIGNSLRAQSDSALLLRAFGGTGGGLGGGFGAAAAGAMGAGGRPSARGLGPAAGGAKRSAGGGSEGEEAFVELVAQGRVVEVMLPDFAAHGVAIALHLFV